MAAFVVPANLAAAARSDASPDRCRWMAGLPCIVADVIGEWSLRPGQPFQPGGQCAWVAPVRDAAGRDLVLKVGWLHAEAAHEANALRLWSGDGAVLVHAARTSGDTNALLLERCRPGTALADAVPEPEQDVIVAGLLRRLWREPAAGHPFRTLQLMCDQWAAEFAGKLAACPDAVDGGLAGTAMELFRELPATAERHVVLCTDLHGENVLAARREPWLVIDPKPYLGDPTYDVVQHMLTCERRLAADPHDFAERMADLCGLDTQRLAWWLFARCVQESIDEPALCAVAARLAP